MAEDAPRLPRIRVPRLSLPKLSRRGDVSSAGGATTEIHAQDPANPGSKPTDAAKADSSTKIGSDEAPTAPGATKPGTGSPPDPNLQERIEGLQGWMAELERKQARLTYFGALAVLIAIAAAGAALYFGLTNRSDSAKKTDLDALTERVDSLESAVTKSSKDTQNALNASIAQLQQSISGLQKQQKQASTKISTLQTQVAANAAAKAAAAPSKTTTATTPGGTKKP